MHTTLPRPTKQSNCRAYWTICVKHQLHPRILTQNVKNMWYREFQLYLASCAFCIKMDVFVLTNFFRETKFNKTTNVLAQAKCSLQFVGKQNSDLYSWYDIYLHHSELLSSGKLTVIVNGKRYNYLCPVYQWLRLCQMLVTETNDLIRKLDQTVLFLLRPNFIFKLSFLWR